MIYLKSLYDLFLDKKRQYSCGYFKNEDDTLETAQNNKIDHIIKKLNLKPNQKVLDIGLAGELFALILQKKLNAKLLVLLYPKIN